MMDRIWEQFGFRVIDVPRVPDLQSGPSQGKFALAATMLPTFLFAIFIFVVVRRKLSGPIDPGPECPVLTPMPNDFLK